LMVMTRSGQDITAEKFLSFLESKGLKPTRERLIILREALSTDGHFEADDLLAILKSKGEKTSRATVYRTLDIISRAGILRKIVIGDTAAQFEKITGDERHDHMICQNCGKKIEFTCPGLAAMQKQLCDDYKFTMRDYSFQIYGICSECAKGQG
jgi:Fur family ferric uptake transcriptional regulator